MPDAGPTIAATTPVDVGQPSLDTRETDKDDDTPIVSPAPGVGGTDTRTSHSESGVPYAVAAILAVAVTITDTAIASETVTTQGSNATAGEQKPQIDLHREPPKNRPA